MGALPGGGGSAYDPCCHWPHVDPIFFASRHRIVLHLFLRSQLDLPVGTPVYSASSRVIRAVTRPMLIRAFAFHRRVSPHVFLRSQLGMPVGTPAYSASSSVFHAVTGPMLVRAIAFHRRFSFELYTLRESHRGHLREAACCRRRRARMNW